MTFHLYGFFVGLGILTGAWVAEKVRKNCFIASLLHCSIYDLLPFIVIPALIGARVYHVIDYWQYYGQSPIEIFYLWQGGLGIYGGILGGILGLGGYTFFVSLRQSKKKLFHCFIVPLLNHLDLIAFGLPVGQAIGRVGNYFNQELYGLPTNLPWGIYIRPENRLPGFENFERFHPLFVYEAVWCLAIFVILICLIGQIRKPGFFFFTYLGLYGLGRFFLEFLRINPWRAGGVNVAQGVSVGVILICLIGLISQIRYDRKYGRDRKKYHS